VGTPVLWGGFLAAMVLLVVIDLTAVRARGGVVSTKAAGFWVAVYVVLALAFAGYLYTSGGHKPAVTFLTAWVIEYALSVDNLFVFIVIFDFFQVKQNARHKLLYWGVLGAFALRGALIGLGSALVTRFEWLLYGFGAVLLYTAYKLLKGGDDDTVEPEKNVLFRWAKKVLPMAEGDHGNAFFARENGSLRVTFLLLVLLVIETSDVLFAFDSIPAALGISQDAFIVFTANACAVMGLRSLFFVVSHLMDKFHYLKTGLGIILAFIGVKLIAENAMHAYVAQHEALLILISLSFVALTLVVAVVWSVVKPPPAARTP
jgi:tellurite resistance protein TerC